MELALNAPHSHWHCPGSATPATGTTKFKFAYVSVRVLGYDTFVNIEKRAPLAFTTTPDGIYHCAENSLRFGTDTITQFVFAPPRIRVEAGTYQIWIQPYGWFEPAEGGTNWPAFRDPAVPLTEPVVFNCSAPAAQTFPNSTAALPACSGLGNFDALYRLTPVF